MIDVKRLDLDVFKGEHLTAKGPPFDYKFQLTTLTGSYILFASSEIEREIWVESLFKVKEINEASNVNFSLKNNVESYQRDLSEPRLSASKTFSPNTVESSTAGGTYKTEFL